MILTSTIVVSILFNLVSGQFFGPDWNSHDLLRKKVNDLETQTDITINKALEQTYNFRGRFYDIVDDKTKLLEKYLTRIYKATGTLNCHVNNLNKLLSNLSVILNNADPYPFVDTLIYPLRLYENLSSMKKNLFSPISEEVEKSLELRMYKSASLSLELLGNVSAIIDETFQIYVVSDHAKYLEEESKLRTHLIDLIMTKLEFDPKFCKSFNNYTTYLQDQKLLPLTQLVPFNGPDTIDQSSERSIIPFLRDEVQKRWFFIENMRYQIHTMRYETINRFKNLLCHTVKELDNYFKHKIYQKTSKRLRKIYWEVKINKECDRSRKIMMNNCSILLKRQTLAYDHAISLIDLNFLPRVDKLRNDENGSTESRLDSEKLRNDMNETMTELSHVHSEEVIRQTTNNIIECFVQITNEAKERLLIQKTN